MTNTAYTGSCQMKATFFVLLSNHIFSSQISESLNFQNSSDEYADYTQDRK